MGRAHNRQSVQRGKERSTWVESTDGSDNQSNGVGNYPEADRDES